MSKEIDIIKECCEIWNNLKDKTKMIDVLIEHKKQIAELQKQLEEKEKIIQMQQNIERYDIGEMLTENTKLRQQLKSQPAEIVEKIKKGIKDKIICFFSGEDRKDFNKILKAILKEYQK